MQSSVCATPCRSFFTGLVEVAPPPQRWPAPVIIGSATGSLARMTPPLSRRTALRGAAVAVTTGAIVTPPASAETRGDQARQSFTVRDNRGRQRVLADT